MKTKHNFRRNLLTRLLCFTLSATLLLHCIPLQCLAVSNSKEDLHTEVQKELPLSSFHDSASNLSESASMPTIVGEEVSLREADTKHFRMSDGSYCAVTYGAAVHYQDDDGHWQDIDNTPLRKLSISGEDTYHITNDKTAVVFPGSLDEGRLFSMAYGDASVSITLMDTYQAQEMVNEIQKISNESNMLTDSSEKMLTYNRDAQINLLDQVDDSGAQSSAALSSVNLVPDLFSTRIAYEQVFPGIDFYYTVAGFDVKEEIVVHKQQEQYRFDFLLETSGLDSRMNPDGSVSLVNNLKEEIYLIPRPFMKDSSGAVSQDVYYTLSEANSGVILSVEADAGWLNDDARSFPVTIDPTLTTQVMNSNNNSNADIYATYVQEGDPNSSGQGTNLLYTGYQSGKDKEYQAFLYFNNMPDIPAGSVVIDARIELLQSNYSNVNCAQIPMGIYEVSQNTAIPEQDYFCWIRDMTWNTKPEYIGNNLIDYSMASNANTGNYVSWEITELVRKWYEQDTQNRTVALIPVGNYDSRKCAVPVFWAYGSGHGPRFIISYRSNVGIESYYSYQTLGAGAAGTAFISDSTGQLTVSNPVVSLTSASNPFLLNLIYNSDSFAKSASASDGIQSTYGLDMDFGKGFKLDIIQKVEEATLGGKNYLIYYDGDGTLHYLLKQGSKYYDEDGLGLTAEKTSDGYSISDNSGKKWLFKGSLLTALADETGNQIQLSYISGDSGHYFNAIYQKNVNSQEVRIAKIVYSGSSVSSIIDYSGRHLSFEYDSSGRLTSISLDGVQTAKYTYAGNRLIGMEDCESDYLLWFTYDSAGRISSYAEWAGYSSSSPSGARVDITYEHDRTCYRDYGADRTMKTDDDILTYYLLDYTGRSVSAYSSNHGRGVVGATNVTYHVAESTTDKRNNRATQSASIGIPAQQLMHNSGFESESGYTWTCSKNNSASTIEISTDESRTGKNGLKGDIPSEVTDSLVASCSTLPLTEGEQYVFSGYVKTSNLNVSGDGGVYLCIKQGNNVIAYSPTIQYSTSESAEDGWVRLSVAFTAQDSDIHTAQIISFGATGTWYADDFQLEKGEAPSNRNLLENGSLLSGGAFWTMGTNARYAEYENAKFIRIAGSPADPISTDSGVGSAWQNVRINLPATQTFVLSGWAMGNAVPDNVTDTGEADGNDRNKSFGLRAIVTYSDNSVSYHYVPFNSNISGWQYASTTIVAPENKQNLNIINICVVCAFETNGNYMIFDDISLVREAAQTMEYDEDGNLKKITTTGVNPDTNHYDENGNLTSMDTGEGGTVEYSYDDTFIHRLIAATDTGTNLTQSMDYDSFGNVTKTTVTASNGKKIVTSSAYSDDGNRLESITDAVGNTVTYTYGNSQSEMFGQPTSVTDGKGNVTTTQYNNLGRITQTSVANGGSLQYTYDKGNLDHVVRNSQTYDFDYDIWGNMSEAKVGTRTLSEYEYADKNGLLERQTYGNGANVSYTYDNLGRVKTAVWENGRTLTYTYTGEGQLYSIADSATGKTDYCTYDTLGRLVNSYQVSTEYTVGEKPIRSNYEYDTSGRLNRREFYTPTTGTASMTYSYNENAEDAITDGTLTSVQMVSGQNIGYTYDPLQRLTDKGVNGGFWEQYAYAPGAESGTTSTQVSGLQTWMGSSRKNNFTYTYDANGNITAISDSTKGSSVSYTYDAQNQLLSATHGNGRTETYTYDTAGNILTFNNGTISHTYTYGDEAGWKDLLTAVDGQSITYDNNGNPTSYYDGYRYTMEWTEGRKLASVTYNNKETAFEYNHEGLRIKKTLSDDSYILYEIVDGVYVGETRYNASGSVAVYIRYILDEGNSPVGISLWYPATGGWTDYHFIKNLQGDVLEVCKVSDGSLAASYTYDSWGNILSQSGDLATLNPFRYRSYYYDTETWFYYLQSRYYDPAIGRWINADDTAYLGADGTPLSYNLFAYCKNNPVSFSDPSGHFAILPFLGAIVGGAVGGTAISTVSYVVGSALSGQEITSHGLINAAATGAVSGAVGGAIGTISLATKAATVAAKGIASAGVGIVMGIKTGIETNGSTLKRVMTGISTGLITAGSTFLGSQIDAYDVAYGFSGNMFTNSAATLFVGTPAEIVSVASQQGIYAADNYLSGTKFSSNSSVSSRINGFSVALVY